MTEKDRPKKRRRAYTGKPPLDDFTDPEHLTPRMKQWAEAVNAGIDKYEAGKLVVPPAGEQQVDRWVTNEAMMKYLLELKTERADTSSPGEIKFSDRIRVEYQQNILAALLRQRQDIEEGKLNNKELDSLIERAMSKSELALSEKEIAKRKKDSRTFEDEMGED